ncbi:MAG: COQ9 family protein [Asticcacaulis sp.]
MTEASSLPALSHLTAAELRLAQAVARFAPDLGFNSQSLAAGARQAGFNAAEAELIAPNGAADVAAILWRGFDAALPVPEALEGLKIREKISMLLNGWLDAAAADDRLAHRLTGFLMLPGHLGLYRRLLWASADRIWQLAGDKALDENHYSKRVIVCGILGTALMTRLTRGGDAQREQVARNIDGVMQFETFKAKLPLRPEEVVLRLAGTLGRLRFGARTSETPAS